MVPGTHDDLGVLRSAFFKQPASARSLDTVIRVRGLRVIGLDSSVPGAAHGHLDGEQLRWLAAALSQPAPDGTILVIHHPPIWSSTPSSELVAFDEPDLLGDVIRGSDVRLILSGHTHRVSLGRTGGVPVWVSPSTASVADVFVQDGFRGHSGGGLTRVDILDGDELVATYVPLTGRDDVLYETTAPD
jgi:3',5'-cyclic AMP phosphodiesterase CpdA